MQNYTFIDSQSALEEFTNQHQHTSWMCFDTEFVGEKRFYTRLCLIQTASEFGFYLIDPFKIDDIQPFLDLITNPSILKITHAGENDYRLLNHQYGILPVNTFDTQIASAFVGYKYPVSFRALVDGELNIKLKKSFTVANWEARPLTDEQLGYALGDVTPLFELWQNLQNSLEKKGREAWANEEFKTLEDADFYSRHPHKEALNSNLIKSLNKKEQVFLVRLLAWRTKVAEEKDYSRDMVIPNKILGQIVRAMRSGEKAMKDNRRIPKKLAMRHWETFDLLYNAPITEEEKAVLKQIPRDQSEDPQFALLFEMLYSVVKYKCMELGVAPEMGLPRSLLKKIKADPEQAEEIMRGGWRGEIFGKSFVQWLRNYEQLTIDIQPDQIVLRRKD